MLGFFSGLRVRLLCLVLLAVIPALAFVVYTSLEHRQLIKRNIEEEIINVTRDIVRFHGQLIYQNRQLLVFLSEVPAVLHARHQECSVLFSDLVKENQELLNLGLADSQGKIICSALPARQSINLADQPYFQEALKSPQVVVGNYQLNHTTNKPYLGLAKSVHNNSGQLKGVIFANLDLDWVQKLMSKDPLPPKGAVAIVDQEGIILTRWPDPQQWVGVQELEGKIIKIVLSQKQGISEVTGIDGLSRLYAFQPLDHASPRGFIFAGIPTKILSDEFSDNFARNLIWLGLAMALALAAAWILSSQFIVQPISALIKTAQQLADGNLGVRTGLSAGQGEIHQLAHSLDQMAEGLQKREKILDFHNSVIVITNQANNVEELLKESVREIANYTNCTAVGIRILQRDGTIPYEASQGFSQKFLNEENHLSPEAIDSEKDLSIKIIKGTITPGIPGFTKHGSFFVNLASRWDTTMSSEKNGVTCSLCHDYGYESMALIPLKIKDRIFGLIHVADPQENMIPETVVRELEKAAGGLILALERLWNEENVRGLTHELMKAQEKERLRISRELHDSVAQELSAVKISLDNVVEILPEKTGKKLNSKIHQISDNLHRVLGSVRELAYGLRPPILDSLGLTRALYQLCEEFTTRNGIKVNLLIAGIEEDKLDGNAIITLYRFIQEGLNNVRHHAQAKNVSIKLVSSYPKIILRLEDDGKGFDVIEQQSGTFLEKHMGLLNMQERVALLGGNMQIESQPEKGTHILVEIPWKEVVREPQENSNDR
ncbi:MAG: cache domain-containing protein [Syntrophobacterales bacterium]|jgi:signal transduction histidine kinase